MNLCDWKPRLMRSPESKACPSGAEPALVPTGLPSTLAADVNAVYASNTSHRTVTCDSSRQQNLQSCTVQLAEKWKCKERHRHGYYQKEGGRGRADGGAILVCPGHANHCLSRPLSFLKEFEP